jgi:hypothetical protein
MRLGRAARERFGRFLRQQASSLSIKFGDERCAVSIEDDPMRSLRNAARALHALTLAARGEHFKIVPISS